MNAAGFFTGIEAFAVKGEAELNTILTAITALQTALAGSSSSSLVMASLSVNLVAAEAFLKVAITDTAPFVTALQTAVDAITASSAAADAGKH